MQQRVMQLLSDSGALSQALIEAGVDSRGHLPHPEPVKRRHQEGDRCDAQHKKPARLEPGGRNSQIHGCAFFVPNAIVIAGDHMEFVVAGPKLCVVGLTARAYVLPLVIHAIQLVAKENTLGNVKTQSGIVDLQIVGACGKSKTAAKRRRSFHSSSPRK